MAWERSIKPGEPARVTFVVKPSDDPQLYEWLMSLPYGKSSGVVRTMLGAAIRGGSPPSPSTVMPKAPATPAVSRHPIALASFDAGIQLSVPAVNSGGITDSAMEGQDEENLFSAMREQFR